MAWTAGWGGQRCLVDECGDLIPEEAGAGAGSSGDQPPLKKLSESGQLIFRGPPAVVVVMKFRRKEARATRLAGSGDSDVIR